MSLSFTGDSHGDSFFVPRRFEVGYTLESDAAICYGMLPVFTATVLVGGLQGTLLSRAAFSNCRCKWIDKYGLSNGVGNTQRDLYVAGGARPGFCLLGFHFHRGYAVGSFLYFYLCVVVRDIGLRLVAIIAFLMVLFSRQVNVDFFVARTVTRRVCYRVSDLAREVFADRPFSNGVVYYSVDQQDACCLGSNHVIRSFVRDRNLR